MNDDTKSCSLKPLINTGDAQLLFTTASDYKLSIKEKVRECFNPRYQPRTIKNKGTLLVLIWSFLVSAMYFYTSHLASRIHHSRSVLNAVQIIMGLTIPLAG